MQSENKVKNTIKNFYSNLGLKQIDSYICNTLFYEIEVPSILLEKSQETIDTLNKPIL